ncbi:MAG: DNA polymerase III subunit beta [Candidatus Paceibacterota bacterium]
MIETEKLKSAISTLYRIVPARTSMPILQNIAFQSRNGRLELTATDIEKSLTLYLNATEEYNFCVPAKTLNELLSVISAPEIEIKQEDGKIIVNRKPGKTTIKTMDVAEFPLTDIQAHNIVDIDAETISYSLQKCLVSTSEDKSKSVLNGILIKSTNGKLIITSADSFRATYTELLFGLPDFEVIIPKEAAQILLSVLKNGKAKMAINQNSIAFYTEDFKFISQLISGNFPDVARLIPQSWETEIEIEKTLLTRAVKSSLIFARDVANIIHFKIENNIITISGESNETGEDTTPIEKFQLNGKDIAEFAVNGTYLLDGLSLVGDKVVIKLNTATAPIGIYLPGDSTLKHIMMPMHLGRR